MKKLITDHSPKKEIILFPNVKTSKISQDIFSSDNGFLSLYMIKPYSRTLILENIIVSGVLKEDGTFIIYFNENKFINIPFEIKENLKNRYGLESILFPDKLFFKGSFMDGFNYDHLSEDNSTFIVNGNMLSFKKVGRTSSICKLKRIDDVIHLNSNVTITDKNEETIKRQKYSNSNLGIDITMQFKQSVA